MGLENNPIFTACMMWALHYTSFLGLPVRVKIILHIFFSQKKSKIATNIQDDHHILKTFCKNMNCYTALTIYHTNI